MIVDDETYRKALTIAVNFILSDYPRDVDIVDIPTLVEFSDQRILVWEPFTYGGRSPSMIAEHIDSLCSNISELIESL
jgi:hypothetical protein